MNPAKLALAIIALSAAPVCAQEVEASLVLELNALQQAEAGCRIGFVAFNGLEQALDRAVFEVAVFDRDGAIDRLVTLGFDAMTAGKTKVLQFELPELDCADIGRVLINDVPACEGAGVAPATCLDRLEATTRLDVTFGL